MPRKLKLILLLPFAAALVLAIVVVGPIRRIRLGLIGSSRIGHIVTNVEAYLCKLDAGLLVTPPSCIDVFFFEDFVCNREIANQWRKRLHVFPFSAIAYVAARLIAMSELLTRRHMIPYDALSVLGLRTERAIHRFRGHLAVSGDVARDGDNMIAAMAGGRPLACLHVRDSSYLRHTQPNANYSYHDYRDWRTKDLARVVEELSNKGFFLVRMGAFVDETFPFAGDNIFDYAKSDFRSDRMDLYLGSRCALWVGAASGLMDVPFAFRRPLVVLNHVCPLIPAEPRFSLYADSIWIFKKYWSEAKGRLLSFREVLETGAGSFGRTGEFAAAGIRLIDNSPEEIREATIEMIERLNGTWIAAAGDEENQARLWSLWGDSAHAHSIQGNVRVGARFLSANPELLA